MYKMPQRRRKWAQKGRSNCSGSIASAVLPVIKTHVAKILASVLLPMGEAAAAGQASGATERAIKGNGLTRRMRMTMTSPKGYRNKRNKK